MVGQLHNGRSKPVEKTSNSSTSSSEKGQELAQTQLGGCRVVSFAEWLVESFQTGRRGVLLAVR